MSVSPVAGDVLGAAARLVDELAGLRADLEEMVHWRRLGGFTPDEAARYQRAAAREAVLLGALKSPLPSSKQQVRVPAEAPFLAVRHICPVS